MLWCFFVILYCLVLFVLTERRFSLERVICLTWQLLLWSNFHVISQVCGVQSRKVIMWQFKCMSTCDIWYILCTNCWWTWKNLWTAVLFVYLRLPVWFLFLKSEIEEEKITRSFGPKASYCLFMRITHSIHGTLRIGF